MSWPTFDSQSILITTHQNPDIDAVGSCLGLMHWLEKKQIHPTIWIPDITPTLAPWLPGYTAILTDYPQDFVPTMVIFLDCANENRSLGVTSGEIQESAIWVNIDHHTDNTYFGDFNIVAPVSSVGELLATHFQSINANITPEIATCLFAALVSDTGGFRFENTTADSFAIANYLVANGAVPAQISSHIFCHRTPESIDVLKDALSRLVVNPSIGLAYTTFYCPNPNLGQDVIDFIRTIRGVSIAVCFRQVGPDEIRINFRSTSEFDVSQFAHQFGGGGHRCASGAMMTGDIETVSHIVISKLASQLEIRYSQ